MRVSYHEGYCVPLPPRHPFPMPKFPALYRLLLGEGLLRPEDVVAPRPADWADLLTVHTPGYLSRLAGGTLGKQAERRMGLPWSEALVTRSRRAVQGTINAALMALEDGLAANLAGGTHHAFPDYGEGFCVLNDVAVAIRVLERSGWLRRALVIDLDVHQGNGTAAVFADDAAAFTFSMHGEKNFPFHKTTSSLDVGLPDGMEDAAYLDVLSHHLPDVLEAARPDLVFYLAGIDVMAGDRFGRIALSRQGLHARDGYVLESVGQAGLPLVLLLSGGYAKTPEKTAELHAVAHYEARRVYR
ncbi:MAG: histone deacetylase family protein [Rhodothermales bacterium]